MRSHASSLKKRYFGIVNLQLASEIMLCGAGGQRRIGSPAIEKLVPLSGYFIHRLR
jgi:hypothetical protein